MTKPAIVRSEYDFRYYLDKIDNIVFACVESEFALYDISCVELDELQKEINTARNNGFITCYDRDELTVSVLRARFALRVWKSRR